MALRKEAVLFRAPGLQAFPLPARVSSSAPRLRLSLFVYLRSSSITPSLSLSPLHISSRVSFSRSLTLLPLVSASSSTSFSSGLWETEENEIRPSLSRTPFTYRIPALSLSPRASTTPAASSSSSSSSASPLGSVRFFYGVRGAAFYTPEFFPLFLSRSLARSLARSAGPPRDAERGSDSFSRSFSRSLLRSFLRSRALLNVGVPRARQIQLLYACIGR